MWSSKAIAALLGAVAWRSPRPRAARANRAPPAAARAPTAGSRPGGYMSPVTESLTGGKKGGTLAGAPGNGIRTPRSGHLVLQPRLPGRVRHPAAAVLLQAQPAENEPTPDLASGPAEISSDTKTVTVHLKEGVQFSPPVNREVTSSRRRLRDRARGQPDRRQRLHPGLLRGRRRNAQGDRRPGQGDRNPRTSTRSSST